jgi:hypothetical protein
MQAVTPNSRKMSRALRTARADPLGVGGRLGYGLPRSASAARLDAAAQRLLRVPQPPAHHRVSGGTHIVSGTDISGSEWLVRRSIRHGHVPSREDEVAEIDFVAVELIFGRRETRAECEGRLTIGANDSHAEPLASSAWVGVRRRAI